MGNTSQDPAKIYDLKKGIALGFEKANAGQKMRIVLSELFYIQAQIFEQNQLNVTRGPNDNIHRHSELFGNDIYLEEIAHIICIILAEVPTLFQLQEMIETLLYVSHGATIICWVVANMPDCFKEGEVERTFWLECASFTDGQCVAIGKSEFLLSNC